MVTSNTDKDREAIIDENLKRVYEEALEEGIPDRFKDLLSKLKQQETEQDQHR